MGYRSYHQSRATVNFIISTLTVAAMCGLLFILSCSIIWMANTHPRILWCSAAAISAIGGFIIADWKNY